ncbi:MAG: hypothetical protein KF760_16225 [Candidatus Eremiobacteraeota bacterium]|nr:hypothetical protein [Candidatus Eremiobacteraeota bacterium]MCW5867878.1 hypothetical protein [Candidatus Eremiobacteraeota bacterium]
MRYLILLLLALPAFGQPAFKGQELYSWKRDGHWNYALLVGTNRNKTWAEIEQAGLGGLDQLEKRLDSLAAGEMIFWFHRCDGGAGQLSYPPAEIQQRIAQACQQRKLELASPR